MAGSVDGTNWTLLAVPSIASGSNLAAVTGSAAGVWVAVCAGFAKILARVKAFTSGAAAATLMAATGFWTTACWGSVLKRGHDHRCAEHGGNPDLDGTGRWRAPLYHQFAHRAACGSTPHGGHEPVIITTTKLPGALAFSSPTEAAAQGSVYENSIVPVRRAIDRRCELAHALRLTPWSHAVNPSRFVQQSHFCMEIYSRAI